MLRLFKKIRQPALLLIILCFSVGIIPLHATKYAGEIFHYSMGVRNLALGSTGLTNLNSNSLAWWNPALLEYKQENSVEFMHAEEFEGLLKYDSISGIYGNKKKFGIVVSRIAIDDIPLTALPSDQDPVGENNQPYIYDRVTNSDLTAFLGFSQKLGKFTLGFTPKFAWRSLAEENGFGFGADISLVSDPQRNFVYAVQVRDFFSTLIFWNNGTRESVNPNVNLEVNYGLDFLPIEKPLRLYLRTEMLFEGRDEAATISIDPVSFDFHAGAEAPVSKYFDLLAGFDIDHLTTGISINYNQVSLLYCFELETELDNSHRISIAWRF